MSTPGGVVVPPGVRVPIFSFPKIYVSKPAIAGDFTAGAAVKSWYRRSAAIFFDFVLRLMLKDNIM